MDDLELPLMDSLKLELYSNATTTLGSQQQQMPSKPPGDLGDQAWLLLKELGNLHIKQAFQKTQNLTPEDQQEFLETIRDIWDDVGKISSELNGWQAMQPTECHLWELQGFPIPQFNKLWELLDH